MIYIIILCVHAAFLVIAVNPAVYSKPHTCFSNHNSWRNCDNIRINSSSSSINNNNTDFYK